jgi:myosin heavy subunit
VKQAAAESNFHVFSYFLGGASTEMKAALHLTASQYTYLKVPPTNASMTRRLKGLLQSMHVLGFSEIETDEMGHLLAAVLLAGNIDFAPVPGSTDDASEVVDRTALEALAAVLQVDVETIENALLTRHIVMSGEVMYKPMDVADCRVLRDTLAQVHSRIDIAQSYLHLPRRDGVSNQPRDAHACMCILFSFTWLVQRLNALLGKHLDEVNASELLVVGVLDIFGFENFKCNSFEQLCINTANEQLQ